MALTSIAALGATVGLNLLGSNTLFKTTYDRAFSSKYIKFIAPCNISERHSDNYSITDHPTEYGAIISDHMFALPKRVDIEVVYSISGNNTAIKTLGSYVGVSDKPRSLEQYYQDFLSLQASKIPFSITTGKRKYNNMVIEGIDNLTDGNSENLLRLSLRCREIQIVYSSITSNKSSKDTQPVSNTGAATITPYKE